MLPFTLVLPVSPVFVPKEKLLSPTYQGGNMNPSPRTQPCGFCCVFSFFIVLLSFFLPCCLSSPPPPPPLVNILLGSASACSRFGLVEMKHIHFVPA